MILYNFKYQNSNFLYFQIQYDYGLVIINI
jgi:hypothetical protein